MTYIVIKDNREELGNRYKRSWRVYSVWVFFSRICMPGFFHIEPAPVLPHQWNENTNDPHVIRYLERGWCPYEDLVKKRPYNTRISITVRASYIPPKCVKHWVNIWINICQLGAIESLTYLRTETFAHGFQLCPLWLLFNWNSITYWRNM